MCLRATAAKATYRSLYFCPKAVSVSSSPAECIKTIRSGCTLGVKGSNPNGFTCDVVKDGRMKDGNCRYLHLPVELLDLLALDLGAFFENI